MKRVIGFIFLFLLSMTVLNYGFLSGHIIFVYLGNLAVLGVFILLLGIKLKIISEKELNEEVKITLEKEPNEEEWKSVWRVAATGDYLVGEKVVSQSSVLVLEMVGENYRFKLKESNGTIIDMDVDYVLTHFPSARKELETRGLI